jgi:DNA-binding CsgD family transcriptional regulator
MVSVKFGPQEAESWQRGCARCWLPADHILGEGSRPTKSVRCRSLRRGLLRRSSFERENSLRCLEYVGRSGFSLYALHRASALYAEACLGLNRLDEAESHINSTLTLATRLRHRPALAGMHRAKGLLHGIRGEAAAVVELSRSVQGWEELEHNYEAAKARFELALAYHGSGQSEAATAELLRLLRTFSEWGAAEDVARTRRALTWLGRKPPRRRPSERLGIPHGLTEREMEIVRLIAQHKSTEEIARELVIRESTLNTHLANVFRKLEINSRAQLVAYVHEAGLA